VPSQGRAALDVHLDYVSETSPIRATLLDIEAMMTVKSDGLGETETDGSTGLIAVNGIADWTVATRCVLG
jgi:hypothetical protein